MTVGTESHSTGHSSGITTTTVAAVKNSTGNTRELYILLDKGYSSSILSDNYLNYVKNIKKSKSHYSTAGAPYKTSTQQIKSPNNIPKHINQDIIRK